MQIRRSHRIETRRIGRYRHRALIRNRIWNQDTVVGVDLNVSGDSVCAEREWTRGSVRAAFLRSGEEPILRLIVSVLHPLRIRQSDHGSLSRNSADQSICNGRGCWSPGSLIDNPR